MKSLSIVQGEGRGHLTQAITLEGMLLRNGHEVAEVLVGESSSRILPGFFNRNIQAPVKRFISPNFLPATDNKRANLKKSPIYNLLRTPEYFCGMCYISQRIKETRTEAVINFYELLTGFTYVLFRPSVPYACVGHQYLFLRQNFEFPNKNSSELRMLCFFTKMTAIRPSKKLALSSDNMEPDRGQQVVVVPPLIRQEVTAIQLEEGNYIHGYMVDSGFADSAGEFHTIYPEVPLRFFWDKADTEEMTRIDEALSFCQIDDVKSLNGVAGCRAYATAVGFEPICETMYLGKPVLMVSAHTEQDCNVHDAMRAGVEITSDSFDSKPLFRFARAYSPNRTFVRWVRSDERRIILELEKLVASQSAITSISTFTNYLSI